MYLAPRTAGRPPAPPSPDPKRNRKRAMDRMRRSKKYLTDLPVGAVKFDNERKIIFLKHYAGCGLMIQSALAAGVCDGTVREALKKDPAFASAFEFAGTKFKERLETEAMRRGHDGWMEPVVQKGRVVHHDCKTCRGFGRIAPEGRSIVADYVTVEARLQLPLCRDCEGTGQGDVVYAFKADSQVFQKLLQRHIPEYRDKLEIDQKVSGGVLVVNAPPATPAEWEAQWAGKRAPTLDAEFSVVGGEPRPALPAGDDLSGEDVVQPEPHDSADTARVSQGPDAEPVRILERRPYNHAGSGSVVIKR